MAADDALFSRAYLRPATSLPDSKRFRTRVYAAFDALLSKDQKTDFYNQVLRELGIRIPGNEWGIFYSQWFEKSAELRDVLDAISLTRRILLKARDKSNAKTWILHMRRIFKEEAVGYILNDDGGVRYLIDEEFERTRFSTIDGLASPHLAAVRATVENAFSKFDREPFANKEAIRSMFEAVETLFKVLGQHNNDLNDGMLKIRFRPLVGRVYGALDASAKSFAELQTEALMKWVNAGHRYRHGQNTEEPLEPPLELAIMFVSQGAAYIRFVIDVYERQKANS